LLRARPFYIKRQICLANKKTTVDPTETKTNMKNATLLIRISLCCQCVAVIASVVAAMQSLQGLQQSTDKATSVALRPQSSAFVTLLGEAAAHAPSLLPNTVVLVEVNSGFLPMADRLQQRCNALRPPLKNVVWVALDPGAAAHMRSQGAFACFFLAPR
jgi:hypothetical protein